MVSSPSASRGAVAAIAGPTDRGGNMSYGVLIEDDASRANCDSEPDMRRFLSNRCKVHRFPDKIFIEWDRRYTFAAR